MWGTHREGLDTSVLGSPVPAHAFTDSLWTDSKILEDSILCKRTLIISGISKLGSVSQSDQ